MSKKKSTTKKTTTDADHPAVLPMKKGGPAKKKGKPQPPADPNVTASETADVPGRRAGADERLGPRCRCPSCRATLGVRIRFVRKRRG